MTRIAVIDSRRIGSTPVGGLIDGGASPSSICVVGRIREGLAGLKEAYGIVDTDDPVGTVDGADVVFLCVKPYLIIGMLEQITGVLDDSEVDAIVVSMAADITLDKMEGVRVVGIPMIRVMPNTPMLVGEGVCAVVPDRFVTESQTGEVVELLGKVGSAEVVGESLTSTVTTVSGSGPAYFFQFVEVMTDVSVDLGLKCDQIRCLVSATAAGTAETTMREGADPAALRADVISPSGTTAAAIRVLKEEGIRRAVHRALQACYDEANEMGK